MELVAALATKVNTHAELDVSGTNRLPVFVQADVLTCISSPPMSDIVPEQDSIASVKLDHDWPIVRSVRMI